MSVTLQTPTLECKFATHVISSTNGDDLHVIKEVYTDANGIKHPRLALKKNYERPYWLTQRGLRVYKEQKEWLPLEDLVEYRCTQRELTDSIKKHLGVGWSKQGLRDLKENIFVFGADVTSTALIKKDYFDKHKTFTPFTNAVGDTETDMIYGHGQIQMATITQKGRAYTVIKKEFIQGYADAAERIKVLCSQHIGEVVDTPDIQKLSLGRLIKEKGIDLQIEIVDTEIEVVKKWIDKAHEWKPDFFSFWNVAFDINKVLEACKRADYDPAELFSDPSIPQEFKSFHWKEGKAKKITASGKLMSYKPSQRWHTLTAPASFYVIDAMSSYRYIRMGKPEEKSYSLDYLLYKNLKITKLKFVQASKFKGADWHRYMQKNYPLEYVVYNIFDCVSMELLDEKTRDIELQLPLMSRFSDFRNFNSQPQRAITDLHFHLIEKEKCVIAMTSGEMKTDFDGLTSDPSGWIIMLPQERVDDNGLYCLEDARKLLSSIRAHAGDKN